MFPIFKIFPHVCASSKFVKVLKSRVLNAVMTFKRDILGRLWCKANYMWDIYCVVKGAQLGTLCVYYCLTDLHANSRKVKSLRTYMRRGT